MPATIQWTNYVNYKSTVDYAALALLLLLNAVANGYVAAIEHVDALWWEPWLWEFSSALAIALVLPLLAWWTDRSPLRWHAMRRQLAQHLLACLVFFALHVALMVMFRAAIYQLADLSYQFDWSLPNVGYEFAKDIRVYLFFVVLFEVYRFVLRRWRGEASQLSEGPGNSADAGPYLQQVLVKMLNQEFLVKLPDVEVIRSAGNYQELVIGQRAYPLRITQANLLQQLDPATFVKINRGELVNLAKITDFRWGKAKEGLVTLGSGEQLRVQKNYVQQLPEALRVIAVG